MGGYYASRPEPADLLARVRARKRQAGNSLDADTILGHRDADRR